MVGAGDGEISPFSELIDLSYADTINLENNAKSIVKRIESKDATLVALIETLGPKLTSTNVQDRVKATDILAHVFTALRKDFLTEKELEFIVEFLVNRLKDQHLVIPKAILCIYPVIQCQNLPSGAAIRLLQQIFQEANVQSHVHNIRRCVFLIVEFMLRKKMNELKEMSSDFVVNFLQAVDGEKDPRNLLLLFQITPCILSNFNLGPFIEDFFEVLACYFPIDFTPIAVPGLEVITRENLASALHMCLSQTNQFSEFLVPLALEKLDSSLTSAKIDALTLLELCCERFYTPSNLKPYLSQIWHSLRREIFMGGNEIVESHSISFLRSVFKVVSSDEETLKTCIDMVFTECKHHLCEPELRLINPTSRILVAMCSASELSCKTVISNILLVLHEQLTQKTVHGERKRIMGITELILSSCREFSEVTLSSLISNWDEILSTWFSFLTSEDQEYVNLSLKILFKALTNDIDFPQKYRCLLQEHLLALLEKNSLSQSTLNTLITIEEKLTMTHGEEFAEKSVPKLLEYISTEIESEKIDGENKGQVSSKVLGECSPQSEFVCEKVVSHLLGEIDRNVINMYALRCVNRIVEKVCQSKDSSKVSTMISMLVEKQRVLDIVFKVALVTSKQALTLPMGHLKLSAEANELPPPEKAQKDLKSNNEVFGITVIIIRNLMRGATKDLQISMVDRFWTQKVKNSSSWDCTFNEFPLALVEAVLGPLTSTIEIHRQDELVEYLLHKSIHALSGEVSGESETVYKRLLAVFLNKTEPETKFLQLLKSIELALDNTLPYPESLKFKTIVDDENEMETELSDSAVKGNGVENVTNINVRNAAILLAWVTKALAMRGIRTLDNWMKKLISLLSQEDVGTVAAEGFNVLFIDDVVSLNPESNCKYRFLYKQRLFQMSVPKLVVGFRESKTEAAKVNYIKALSSQLKQIPKEILAMEIENVFPLLVASLKFNTSSAPVIISTLNAFTEMMHNSDEETEKRLVEYCHDIVPQLVKLSGFLGSMEVRKLSLQCLQKCAKCPSHVIIPLRDMVIKDLHKCLDDPKRIVRTEARLTRNTWILVTAPGGM